MVNEAINKFIAGDVSTFNQSIKEMMTQSMGQKLEEKKQEISKAYFGKK